MSETIGTPESATCYRHADRRAGVSCQRCGRSICPTCMVQASVGYQCPDCTKQGAKDSPVITVGSLEVQPLVTQVLIALNVVVFLTMIVGGGSIMQTSQSITARYSLFGAGVLVRNGPMRGVAVGEWYRLVTGGFLHSGIVHLGMNMVVLWLVGTQVERALGHARYLALYVASLLAGSFAVMVYSPGVMTVGASGAIFGLLGAAVALQRDRGINPMKSGLGGLIILNVVITFAVPGIAIAGHIGGLIGGFATGWLLFRIERRTGSARVGIAVCVALAALFVLGGVWAAHFYYLHYPNAVLHF